jgi:hypothetical protein
MLSRAFAAFFFLGLLVACGALEGIDDALSTSDECCPRDEIVSGSMHLGGSAENGCFVTHDFFCHENFRVEKDEHGCEVWRSDIRRPRAGENSSCFAVRPFDAGIDAPADAPFDARSDARADAKADAQSDAETDASGLE